MIEKFSIFGLNNERDIIINFEKENPYKILVAENGYGKTSVLNAFYAVLSNNKKKLRNINFEKIEIKFFDKNKTYSIERKELLFDINTIIHGMLSKYVEIIGSDNTQRLIDIISSGDLEQAKLFLKNSDYFSFVIRRNAEEIVNNLNNHIVYNQDHFNDSFNLAANSKKETYKNLDEIFSIINEKSLNILYLPTYRRVEESLKNLQHENIDDIFIKSINFGMNDVDIKIKDLTKKILKSLQIEFQKLNGQVLSMLIEGNSSKKNKKNFETDFILEKLSIILKRLPEEYLSKKDKDKILDLVKEDKLKKQQYQTLFRFVKNLIEAYSKQAENEKLIIDFLTVCNKYLINKEIIYDDNKVEVKIVRKKEKEHNIELHMLSSGEKQLISLFANIFLEKDQNIMIFFDEPELSLSIEWQKMILKDIIDSGKCKFLFATTHSPFIFEHLIKFTSDLSQYSKEI